MKKFILVCVLVGSFLHAEDNATKNFEALIVEGSEQNDAFVLPNYINSQSYLESAPSQRRLTTAQAMHLPGVQGDPVKAVKLLAGVTSTGSTGELIIHASKPTETLSVLNYLPIGYLFHLQGLHSVISPEATDQLDIYMGGFDVTYNNAMGGVLDITPKYPMGDNSGHIHVGIFDASFGFDGKLGENTSFYIGGRRSYFDLFIGSFTPEPDPDTSTQVSITRFPSYWDGTLIVTHQMGAHQLSWETIGAQDKFEFLKTGDKNDPAANGALDFARGFVTSGLRHLYDDGTYKSNTLGYYLNNTLQLDLFADLFVNTIDNAYGIKHISTYELPRHQITGGIYVEGITTKLDFNSAQQPSSDAPSGRLSDALIARVKENLVHYYTTVFAQDVYRFAPQWAVRYGAQAIYGSGANFGTTLDPRVSIIYEASPRDILAFSSGRYTQTPAGARLLPEIGNPNLTYERSLHYTMKYEHRFSDTHSMELEPYYKTFEDLAIEDRIFDENNQTQNYQSVGAGEAYGADVTYKFQDENIYVMAAYTYVRANRQLFTNDPTLYRFYAEIPHTFNGIVGYKLNERWSFSTLVKFQSGLPYTPVVGVTTKTNNDGSTAYIPTYGTPFSAQLNDYLTLNIKTSYTKKLEHGRAIEWSLEIMNATNAQNQVAVSYNDDFTKKRYVNDLPLIPWFDVTYRF